MNNRHRERQIALHVLSGILALVTLASPGVAQDLEPRRWSHLPIGANVAGFGYLHTDADIALNPVLLLEDVTMDMDAMGFVYVRSFEMFGRSARVDLRQGYADAEWTGLLDGVPGSTGRIGFTDTTLRAAIPLLGAPPLKGKEFKNYRDSVAHCETIVGIGLAIDLPTGHYEEDRLLNIGSNRFTFRPQLGVVHNRGKLSMELTASSWFYTKNDEFFGENKLENDPLYSLQGHLVYTFRPGLWIGTGIAYGTGKESTLNGMPMDDHHETLIWGGSFGVSITPKIGGKIGYLWRETLVDTGSDSGTFNIGFSILW